MRITGSGKYSYCRWASDTENYNIQTTQVDEYFQNTMQPIRQLFLDGQQPPGCHLCKKMEEHKKVSGRQKQLLKVGVRLENFEKTLKSSPWTETFADKSFSQMPQDWQIDLGNYCNSACIFCVPESSSRLATEWKRIGFINELPPAGWTDDPVLVENFVSTLQQSQHIQYLHFIGGETLITPAFKTILRALIQSGLHKKATIGFTTNLITWDDSVIELLTQFDGVNLGMSIESFDSINDYVRWPSAIPTVHTTLDKWLKVAKQYNWLVQFRTTPNILTIGKLLSVYDYAWDHNIAIESCNFLNKPEFMKPSVLPMEYRRPIVSQMETWISQRAVGDDIIVNTRDPNIAKQQLVQDLTSYVNHLRNEPDNSYLLPKLVTWLKRIEANRGNSILTYLPEYEELFRAAGY